MEILSGNADVDSFGLSKTLKGSNKMREVGKVRVLQCRDDVGSNLSASLIGLIPGRIFKGHLTGSSVIALK